MCFQKVKLFIKNNYHRLFIILLITSLIILHRYILFTGDDYAYSEPVKSTFSDFLKFHLNHYMNTNGRAVIHFFLTLAFADSDMNVWRIAAPIFTAIILIITAKAFTDQKHEFRITVSVLSVVFLSFGGVFSASSIYSITPAFNYLYPLILMSLTALLVKCTYLKGKNLWYLPLVSFFAGATMEQIGIMSIGYIILISLSFYLRDKTLPNKSVIVALITSVLGYLSVMLAPGTFVRTTTSTRPFLENFIAASTMLINIKSFAVFNCLMIFCLCYWLLSLKTSAKVINIFNILLSIGLIIGHILNMFVLFNNSGISFDSSTIISLAWKLFDIGYIFAMIYVPALIFFVKKESKYAIHMIIALGSIFILFFASVSEYRPLVPAVIVFSIFIALTVSEYLKRHSAYKSILLAAASIVCIANFGFTVKGFQENYYVYNENIRRIEEYKASANPPQTLVLLPCADPETAAYSINNTGRDYFSMYSSRFKDYYNIPHSTQILIESKDTHIDISK